MGMPSPKKAMPPARFSGGRLSAIRAWAVGVQPASPTPTPMRASSNCQKFCATPHSAVITDHTATNTAIIRLRLLRPLSATRAIGTPSVA